MRPWWGGGMVSAVTALAFDRAAGDYDAAFGRNPVGLVFRHVFQERLRALFGAGSRVLDLGCGTGEDALFLAGAGVRVHALDASQAMLEQARAKAARLNLPRIGSGSSGESWWMWLALGPASTALTRISECSTVPTSQPSAGGSARCCGRGRRSCSA